MVSLWAEPWGGGGGAEHYLVWDKNHVYVSSGLLLSHQFLVMRALPWCLSSILVSFQRQRSHLKQHSWIKYLLLCVCACVCVSVCLSVCVWYFVSESCYVVQLALNFQLSCLCLTSGGITEFATMPYKFWPSWYFTVGLDTTMRFGGDKSYSNHSTREIPCKELNIFKLFIITYKAKRYNSYKI
jgi:hypothetical protein